MAVYTPVYTAGRRPQQGHLTDPSHLISRWGVTQVSVLSSICHVLQVFNV